MRTSVLSLLALLSLSALAACGNEASPTKASPSPSGATANPSGGVVANASRYALSSEPAHAIPVLEAKAKGETKDVTVVGRLKDTVPGFAAFTITDPTLAPCAMGEGCPTPWDYCCIADDKVADATISVAVRAKGEVVESPVPELRNLDLVVVHGAIVKGADGTLRLEADGWYRKERPDVAANVVFPK